MALCRALVDGTITYVDDGAFVNAVGSPFILNGRRVQVAVDVLPPPPDDIEPPIDQTPSRIALFQLATTSWSQLVTLHVRATGIGFLADQEARKSLLVEAQPYRAIEDIARYVAGDGTDPLRVALADGIRSGRREG